MKLQIPEGDIDVLAIGETVVDLISVKESESLHDVHTFRKYLGGAPANIAIYVAKLGGSSAVISKTGSGAFGQFVKAELGRYGVSTDYLVMDHRTHTTLVFVSHTQGTPDFEAFRSSDFQLTPCEVEEEAIVRAKVIHTSTWPLSREPSRSAVAKAFRLAHEQGKIISLDPNYTPEIWSDYEEARRVLREMLRFVSITKPSQDDAERLFGRGHKPEEYIKMYHDLGPRLVVFTMGADGVFLSEEGQLNHVPARPVEVVDATGAGDAFWAALLVAHLDVDGKPWPVSARFAHEVAALKLRVIGHIERMIDREAIYRQLEDKAGQEWVSAGGDFMG